MLINNVPEPLLSHLTLNSDRYRTSQEVQKNIETYYKSRRGGSNDDGSASMEVDAVYGNSKSKGKDSKGKSKGKDGKGKVDKGKQVKGKFDKGKKSKSEPFEGHCSNKECGKWGHRWRDCRKKGGGAYKEGPPQPSNDKSSNAVENDKQGKKEGEASAIEIEPSTELEQFWEAQEAE